MPKLKTHKSISKRIKVSGSGKLLRRKASRSHNFAAKQTSTKRTMVKEFELSHSDQARVKKLVRNQ